LRLYVNGVEVGVADYFADINQPNIDYLSLGGRLALNPDTSQVEVDLAAPNMLPGRLDEVAIWTRSLTADEVVKLFAAGNEGQALTTITLEPPGEPDGTYKIGLNFGVDQQSSSLAATDVAGVEEVKQANWNNLSGQSGSTNDIVAQVDGTTAETTDVSVTWASNNTWASTGAGEENNALTGADKTLMTGYLDTGNATTTSVTISNLPPALTAEGYDVYVYAMGGVGGRGGGFRILDASNQAVLRDYVRAQSGTNLTEYIEVPTGGAGDPGVGNYLVFSGLTASAITIEATTENDQGFSSTPRAPINAVQLVAPSSEVPALPIAIAQDAEGNIVITYEGTLEAADAVVGPYTAVQGATSPYTTPASGTARFFRAVSP
jgi:hypothetical protein